MSVYGRTEYSFDRLSDCNSLQHSTYSVVQAIENSLGSNHFAVDVVQTIATTLLSTRVAQGRKIAQLNAAFKTLQKAYTDSGPTAAFFACFVALHIAIIHIKREDASQIAFRSAAILISFLFTELESPSHSLNEAEKIIDFAVNENFQKLTITHNEKDLPHTLVLFLQDILCSIDTATTTMSPSSLSFFSSIPAWHLVCNLMHTISPFPDIFPNLIVDSYAERLNQEGSTPNKQARSAFALLYLFDNFCTPQEEPSPKEICSSQYFNTLMNSQYAAAIFKALDPQAISSLFIQRYICHPLALDAPTVQWLKTAAVHNLRVSCTTCNELIPLLFCIHTDAFALVISTITKMLKNDQAMSGISLTCAQELFTSFAQQTLIHSNNNQDDIKVYRQFLATLCSVRRLLPNSLQVYTGTYKDILVQENEAIQQYIFKDAQFDTTTMNQLEIQLQLPPGTVYETLIATIISSVCSEIHRIRDEAKEHKIPLSKLEGIRIPVKNALLEGMNTLYATLIQPIYKKQAYNALSSVFNLVICPGSKIEKIARTNNAQSLTWTLDT